MYFYRMQRNTNVQVEKYRGNRWTIEDVKSVWALSGKGELETAKSKFQGHDTAGRGFFDRLRYPLTPTQTDDRSIAAYARLTKLRLLKS